MLAHQEGIQTINTQDDAGRAALHQAVQGKSLDMVEALLNHQADINIPAKNGNTPLHIATFLVSNPSSKNY